MAKEIKCEHCGKKLDSDKAKNYMGVYCNQDCAISKLFGIIGNIRKSIDFTEQGR